MTRTARVLSVVGARPQFIKLAPVSRALREEPVIDGLELRHEVIHTGQHYDAQMSEVFFDQLDLPRPSHHLEVGSGTHAVQTGLMLQRLERCFLDERPDAVLIYGDTNSTLAAALAAAKLCIPLVHVEAGLRSFNRAMPEEINRIVADHISDLLLVPTAEGMRNLGNEGLAAKSVLSGDVMYDAVLYNRDVARRHSRIVATLGLEATAYGVVTVHRPSNTEPEVLGRLLEALQRLAAGTLPLVFPMHPRTRSTLGTAVPAPGGALRIIEPLGYLDMLSLVDHARIVLTDSGGLQKEAFFLQKPCVTLRDETEWVETVATGANRLTGNDPQKIAAEVSFFLGGGGLAGDAWSAAIEHHYGDGHAARRIRAHVAAWLTDKLATRQENRSLQ
jgi:UDP-GlcNAc3NAcA epimerase